MIFYRAETQSLEFSLRLASQELQVYQKMKLLERTWPRRLP